MLPSLIGLTRVRRSLALSRLSLNQWNVRVSVHSIRRRYRRMIHPIALRMVKTSKQ